MSFAKLRSGAPSREIDYIDRAFLTQTDTTKCPTSCFGQYALAAMYLN